MRSPSVPDAPRLFKNFQGVYAIHFPSVKKNGARKCGSVKLRTRDPRKAKAMLEQWLTEGHLAELVANDQKTHEAYLARRAARASAGNGHAYAVPALAGEPGDHAAPPQDHGRQRAKRKARDMSHAQAQLKMLSAQLHAIALNVQLLGELIGADDGDD